MTEQNGSTGIVRNCMSRMRNELARLFWLGFLTGLLGLVLTGFEAHVRRVTETRLLEAQGRSTRLLLALGALEGGLRLVESGEVGEGLKVKPGKVVAPVADRLRDAGRGVTAGLAALVAVRTLGRGMDIFDWYVLAPAVLLLTLWLTGWLKGTPRSVLARATRAVWVGTLVLYVILPGTCWFAITATDAVLEPVTAPIAKAVMAIQKEVAPAGGSALTPMFDAGSTTAEAAERSDRKESFLALLWRCVESAKATMEQGKRMVTFIVSPVVNDLPVLMALYLLQGLALPLIILGLTRRAMPATRELLEEWIR